MYIQRKSLVPLFVLSLIVALLHTTSMQAQAVSYTSGFYPVDSLFFTVNQQAPKGGKIEISVNCFTTANCFNQYTTGIWLYNRNNTPNTWEDQQFSRAPAGGAVDTLAPRGKLDKVNVVRVRTVNADGTIATDSAYFIGVLGKGAPYPYMLPVVQLLVDSMDAFGPLGFYGPGIGVHTEYIQAWNYMLDETPRFSSYVPRSRVEKACIIQILNTGGHPILYQNCGIHTNGNESRSLPNKSLEVVARTDYSNSNTFKTYFLGNKKSDFHSIRLSAGGSGQQFGFGSAEIAEGIVDGLNIGEVPVKPVITFLNGSYWSLTFAEGDTREFIPSDVTRPEEISVFSPQYFILNPEFIQLFHNLQIDTQNVTWTKPEHGGETVGTSVIYHGNKDLFIPASKKLLGSVVNKTPLSFADIDALIDLNSWITYICLVDFGRIKSSIQHHVYIGTAPGKKMYLLLDEAKDFAMSDPGKNQWKERILAPEEPEERTFSSIVIKDIILKNKQCIQKLCLRYEDLLNSNFKPEKTIPVIDKLSYEFLPEYGKYWRTWRPNSGVDSFSEVAFIESVRTFCKARPDSAWQQLAEQWMPDSKFHLSDRKKVTVILDSVPAGTAMVRVNSLELTKTWEGLYYPNPTIEISMIPLNVPAGYTLVWKEHADKPLSFDMAMKKEITLTPVLRKAKK